MGCGWNVAQNDSWFMTSMIWIRLLIPNSVWKQNSPISSSFLALSNLRIITALFYLQSVIITIIILWALFSRNLDTMVGNSFQWIVRFLRNTYTNGSCYFLLLQRNIANKSSVDNKEQKTMTWRFFQSLQHSMSNIYLPSKNPTSRGPCTTEILR